MATTAVATIAGQHRDDFVVETDDLGSIKFLHHDRYGRSKGTDLGGEGGAAIGHGGEEPMAVHGGNASRDKAVGGLAGRIPKCAFPLTGHDNNLLSVVWSSEPDVRFADHSDNTQFDGNRSRSRDRSHCRLGRGRRGRSFLGKSGQATIG